MMIMRATTTTKENGNVYEDLRQRRFQVNIQLHAARLSCCVNCESAEALGTRIITLSPLTRETMRKDDRCLSALMECPCVYNYIWESAISNVDSETNICP